MITAGDRNADHWHRRWSDCDGQVLVFTSSSLTFDSRQNLFAITETRLP
jgi:hypothetical protein